MDAVEGLPLRRLSTGIPALDSLTGGGIPAHSLTVLTGSIYGFIGPNGSGKTTTLRMIMHILLPDEGVIEVLGSGATGAAPSASTPPTAWRTSM